ncbi:MAG TPA: hypothetical protein IGS17_19280 [Oscillatoriales cyanobacterium M59_W2019_021]|nr:hypothetical protein [Oscillatoriales cyanobacterium M4454_W2019_049]HIK53041.1 hypothetical protein [Oscillatoriales cyanobacterium M59_W2019_021]
MSQNGKRQENIHAADSDEACEEMGKKYGWELMEIRENGDKLLPKDCVFEGEQTSFQDMWHDNYA